MYEFSQDDTWQLKSWCDCEVLLDCSPLIACDVFLVCWRLSLSNYISTGFYFLSIVLSFQSIIYSSDSVVAVFGLIQIQVLGKHTHASRELGRFLCSLHAPHLNWPRLEAFTRSRFVIFSLLHPFLCERAHIYYDRQQPADSIINEIFPEVIRQGLDS